MEDVDHDVDREKIEKDVACTPASGPHRAIGWVAGIATLGSFLFGYDTGVISGALPYMHMARSGGGLALTPSEEGLIGAFLLIGAAFGALFGGRLSDRYGRKHNLILLSIIFAVGALACTASPTLWVLYPSRFLLGLAVGGASATVPVYLAEMAPARIRGFVVAIDQLMIVTGQLAAFTMNAIVTMVMGGPTVTIEADPAGLVTPGSHPWREVVAAGSSLIDASYTQWFDQLVITGGNGNAWRWMLILCTIPAILLWLGMRLVPESPRWLAANDRYIEAIGALKRVRDERDLPVHREMTDIVRHVHISRASHTGTLRDVFHIPWLRKLFFVSLLIAASNQLTGVNTVMYYAPRVLEYAGMTTSSAIVAQVANGVMSVIGAAIGLFLIFRLKRRQILLFCMAAVAVCMCTLAGLFAFAIQPSMDAGIRPPVASAIAVLVVMGIFMLIVQSSNGPVVWTMLGEIFPASVRGAANGTAVFVLWIINATVAWTFPVMMDSLGGAKTYLIYGIINVIMFGALWRWMPETAGLSMEEIEFAMKEQFSGPRSLRSLRRRRRDTRNRV